MKIKFFLVSILILCALPLKAGLYNCDTPDGTPHVLPSEGESKITFETKAPYFKPYHLKDNLHQNKTPFLIYYAVDSSEAFMQYSVRFEIGKLQESCTKSPNVNFVAFLNSLYVDKNQFIYCKNSILRYRDISNYPALNDSLKSKRKFISIGDHTEDDLGPLTYRVRYFVHSNESFGRYPLSHPDFLYDLISFAITEEELFPSDKYIPFLNLKSHGSDNRVLAGMHECQEKAKELTCYNLAPVRFVIRRLKKIAFSKGWRCARLAVGATLARMTS